MLTHRRITSAVLTFVLAATMSVGIAAPAAEAAGKPRVFANCTQLNKVYRHGVGQVGAHDKSRSKNFRPVTTFTRDDALYQANRARDADNDGIACEKR
ncbi:Excalibur calcium-binding domain-containing protein [Nakamurella panacisegetis]|uniref:Excalibur calcium-binding domain-containing protein n=1 Tax=Nakamurella panacisegetis TaxID=1090615 RepID=A0A1H0SXN8_9ACTN|nr:excalibur calcium-binding domain-containing protein [Nakamurella panacisegetis]SDP46563.1 Excalibur calcium-binding domain-containing protein [Nakamurella panacisegetis]